MVAAGNPMAQAVLPLATLAVAAMVVAVAAMVVAVATAIRLRQHVCLHGNACGVASSRR